MKAVGDPAQLTDAAVHAMNTWLISSITGRQNEYFQYRPGLLDEELWRTSETIIRVLMNMPYATAWWSTQGRALVTQSFASHVDGIVAAGALPVQADATPARLRSLAKAGSTDAPSAA